MKSRFPESQWDPVTHVRLAAGLTLMALVYGLLCNSTTAGTDLIYVSYGDRRGFTRPNAIEGFDSALSDLGVFSSSALSIPQGLALGSDGNIYVANFGNDTISRITREGVGFVFAHTASGPTSLVFDRTGNLYVANYWASNIQKFTPDGVGSLFATTGIIYPTGLAIDGSGNIYVANAGNLTIQKITPQGVVSTFAQTPEANRPFGGLACDDLGNLYLGCQATNGPGILKFTPNGVRSIFQAGLGLPTSFAFDGEGNIYAANYGSDTIIKLSPTGALLASASTLTHDAMPSPWGIAVRPPCRITCPTNLVLCANAGECGAVVQFPGAFATNCAGLNIECVPPPGSYFPIGTNLVTCVAKNSGGQVEDSCSFQIVVRGCEPPVIHSISASPRVLWPPNNRLHPVTVTVAATDNCALARCKIISVVGDERKRSPGIGRSGADWQLTGDLTLNLRAQGSGDGENRIYTIVVECTDASGNASRSTISVTVPHDQGRSR
jgi:sugar lactone lactonase YvrE